VTEVRVPDIGDFTDVPVIEVLVAVGDEVEVEAPLVTLESDKASMDIPSPVAGKVTELRVGVDDKVSEGDVIAVVEEAEGGGGGGGADADRGDDDSSDDGGGDGAAGERPASAGDAAQEGDSYSGDAPERDTSASEREPRRVEGGPPEDADVRCDVLVVGAGPGGYTAAFRAADLGKRVVLVERHEALGGVCLNVGCIPSKALLHTAKVLAEAAEAGEAGIAFGEPEIDLDALRSWKDGVVRQLTDGLGGMAKRREVEVLRGEARFTGPYAAEVDGKVVGFEHCIIAAGSRPAWLPFLPEDDERVMDSTGALELPDVPGRLLVIGGGIIGLEMATVFDALGSEVTVVELTDGLIPGCDRDLVKPLQKRIEGRYAAIHTGVKVTAVEAGDEALRVTFEGGPEPAEFDRVLVAVGRRPNGDLLDVEAAGVEVDDRGFIRVDEQLRTNIAHIHAIGDIVGEPMLAHKAMHEGKVAAEVIAGEDVTFDARAIPSVAYTDPEVAWAGLTETQAKEEGVEFEKGAFPWSASGRALSQGRPQGTTKLLVDPKTRRVLGGGAVGAGAGELIAEVVHAIEMGAVAEDVALTIHPHPTLSESVGLAAEVVEGTITDLPPKRR
jgi:dihydrolipoamide dehydrogenase